MPQGSEGLHDLRCEICRFRPKLAVYGVDSNGKLFVWVKVFKQRRLFAEMVFTGGQVRLRCRDCARWHTVTIVQPNRVDLEQEELPDSLPIS